MLQFIFDKFESLKVRILGGICIIFILAMGMVLYGVYTYQRDRLLDLASQRAMNLSDVIAAGLRSSMLQNNRSQSRQSIKTILRVAGTTRISVLNTAGKIIMASDSALEGRVVDKMTSPDCMTCHRQGKKMPRTIVADQDGEKVISTVTLIKNEPACYGCHTRNEQVNGILLVESSFSSTTAMLQKLAQRIVLTGLVALLGGVLLLNYIVSRFFTRPLKSLQHGFEEVGRGNFGYWVQVEGGGEIGYMADSFNVMSRAIGRFVDEIKEKTEEVTAHYMIVDSLSQTIDKKVLKEVVVDLIGRLLKAECVSLALAVKKYDHIFEIVKIRRADKRYYHGYYNADSGEIDQCAFTRKDLLEWSADRLNSISYNDDSTKLLLPLRHEKMAIGILSVIKADGKKFSKADRKIVQVLSHHLSISFANAQLYDMAITDGLTTLYTKRHFQMKITDLITAFHATKRGFGLIILDLDYFKQVNDEYGHQIGDQVLMRFAELVRANIRHGDLAFRYGGEEFAVLMKGDNLEDAVRIAERIRLDMENLVLEYDGVPPFSKTVSIGIAGFPHHFSTAEELINAADAAMYQAKRAGRNQVVVYSSDFLKA